MPFPSFRPPFPGSDPIDYLVGFIREFNYFISELDDANMNHITAKSIKVDELSAISADLGTITAGEIYGAFIATAQSTYPRIEFSATDNLLVAYFDSTHSIEFAPTIGSSPGIGFKSGSDLATMYFFNPGPGVQFVIDVTGGINLRATADMVFATTGNYVFDSWNQVVNTATSRTLQQDLNAKANAFSGYSGSVSTGSQTLTFSNGILVSVV